MKDFKELINKLNRLYDCIIEEGGIIDFNWCTELLYPYYLHFNDSEARYRAGSLIAFLGLLTEWEDGSGFPFYSGSESYQCHEFDKYMDNFFEYSNQIEAEFPNIFSSIHLTLIHLFHFNDLFEVFPNIDRLRLKDYKNFIKNRKVNKCKDVFKEAFKEAGIILDYS